MQGKPVNIRIAINSCSIYFRTLSLSPFDTTCQGRRVAIFWADKCQPDIHRKQKQDKEILKFQGRHIVSRKKGILQNVFSKYSSTETYETETIQIETPYNVYKSEKTMKVKHAISYRKLLIAFLKDPGIWF